MGRRSRPGPGRRSRRRPGVGEDPYTVDVARVVADPGWEVVALDAPHVAIGSRPELVVRERLARG